MWPVARMGVGKTKILLTVLDQHFYDPRKKLPVAPKQSIISNLLDEMLLWATKEGLHGLYSRHKGCFCEVGGGS